MTGRGGTSLLFFRSHNNRTRRGTCPSSSRCCISTQRGGAVPSPSCPRSYFHGTKKGMCPSSSRCISTRRGGAVPPRRILIPISMGRGGACAPPRPVVFSFRQQLHEGACPSSSRCCHFDATGRAGTLPVVFSFPL